MRRTMESSFGKMPTTSARRFTSLLRRSKGLVRVQLGPVLARESHVGEHVVLALVYEPPSFGQRARSWSATWRQVCRARLWSGCRKAWRGGGDHGCWPLGT